MSSIYRKGGADGVYYYQTYVYNPETKKKDKRIFHSLSTRDLMEAEIRQAELDAKYEVQDIPGQTKPRFAFLTRHRGSMALVAGTAIMTVFIVNMFRASSSPGVKPANQVVTPLTIQKEAIVPPEAEETLLTQKLPYLEDESSPVILKPDHEEKRDAPALTIPEHTVVRVENISSVFHQGKIYVTVDEKTSTQRLRLLCKSLTKQYPEFSNIVICLYATSPVGVELAKGTGSNFSLREQNQAWLVLYSYNQVEGDYFDDEPGKYLGS